ncbi:MAG: hypothetical protein OEY52_05050 [Gammaproteobacteria bacterium]|nr:hypothetical protein [Gammaproteobacteria bacterium]
MKYIPTDFMHISILDDRTVLVEAMPGVEIDGAKSRYANELIQKEMPGEYGMIIDRKSDYSIVPVAVYDILNSIDNLKAIAIVVHGTRSFLPFETEKNLFKGELEIFQTIREAHEWIGKVLS